MKSLKLSREEADSAFRRLAGKYTVHAPKRCRGLGRHSDTDLVTYEQIRSLSEIEFSSKTHFSAKSVVFPIREALFSFDKDGFEEVQQNLPPTIVFLRACDIHALSVLDAMFLEHGGGEDPYYRRHRRKMTCFLMECPEASDECFCVSMGTNRSEDYSVFMRPEGQGYAVQIVDSEFDEFFHGGTETQVQPRFVEEDATPVTIPGNIDNSMLTDELWLEYSERCIACGRCNTSCPTCSCFTMRDIRKKDSPDEGTRQRIWSSCQIKHFSLLAGGHDFRASNGQRLRYKVLHKIHDFSKAFGRPMCVGCGRCDEVCPEYISMKKCLQKIANTGLPCVEVR